MRDFFTFEIFMAFRHIVIRRRQTVLSVTAVALAVSISLVFTSLGNGSQALLTGIVEEKLPHVTVVPEEGEKYIHLYHGLLSRISGIPEVQETAVSLSTTATLSFKDHNRNVLLRGVEARNEDAIYKIGASMIQGDFLSIQNGKRAVLGYKLAQRLRIKVGDKVQMSFPRASSMNLTITGIFDTGTPLDESVVYVSLPVSRQFLREGDVVTSVELHVKDIDRAQEIASIIDSLGYNSKSWQENNPEIMRSINVGGFWRTLSVALVMIISAFGIAAIMNLLVLEKTKEIGMLLAMGATGSDIRDLFIWESGILGLMGGFAGCVLGLMGIFLVGSFRFNITAAGQEITNIPLRIDPWNFPEFALAAIIVGVLAGVYPAYRASRLNPVEALRS